MALMGERLLSTFTIRNYFKQNVIFKLKKKKEKKKSI